VQLAILWRSDFHFDFPERGAAARVLRYIPERVLLAKVSRDFFSDTRHAILWPREKSYATGVLAEPLKDFWVLFFTKRAQ
jgi:hypothetical protein